MKKIISQINSILSQKTQLKPKDICICGLSGGQDSVLLFIILLHLKNQWNINIQLLHFNHFWQQKNFFSTQHVWKLAFIFNNPIYIIPSELFLHNEKKARQWRQQGLDRICCIEKCEKILTGHTATDRIETAFWHLIRGTSPQGLLSLKWQNNLIAPTQFFNFPKFQPFHTQIFSFYQFSKKNFNSNSKILKKNTSYKKSKNKKLMQAPFCFKSLTDKNDKFLSPENKKSKFLFHKNDLLQLSPSSLSSDKYKMYLSTIELRENVVYQKTTKKIYKKTIWFWIYQPKNSYSFLVFNHCMLIINSVNFENKMIDIQNKHQIKYSFLIFNILFSKKNILRPLLIFHRNDIIMFSKTYLLPILCDPSNQKIRWSRNRLRHQLFPLLRFFFNPNIESLVNNFLEISVEEQNYIEYLIQKIILYWLKKERNYNDIEKQVQILPKAIQRRLLQKIFQSYTNLQPNLLQIEILRENVDKNQCS